MARFAPTFALLALAAVGCDAPPKEKVDAAPRSDAVKPAPAGSVELRPAPAEIAHSAALVREERERASAKGRDLVVYVGASWCEPCRYFHDAAAAGELSRDFPRLTLLELDRDRHETQLRDAGYLSRYVPLFALPGPDGRASGKHIEGSIKGPGAVAEITPRLRKLLADGKAR